MNLSELKYDNRNYRIHNDKNKNLIKHSVEEVGFGRSIVIDSQNEIIAGNGLVSQLDKNTKIKLIETNGKELVVVKRVDLSTNDEKRKKLAIYDNSASDTSSMNEDFLKEDFSYPELHNLGVMLFEPGVASTTEHKESTDTYIRCPACGYVGNKEEFKVVKDGD